MEFRRRLMVMPNSLTRCKPLSQTTKVTCVCVLQLDDLLFRHSALSKLHALRDTEEFSKDLIREKSTILVCRFLERVSMMFVPYVPFLKVGLWITQRRSLELVSLTKELRRRFETYLKSTQCSLTHPARCSAPVSISFSPYTVLIRSKSVASVVRSVTGQVTIFRMENSVPG